GAIRGARHRESATGVRNTSNGLPKNSREARTRASSPPNAASRPSMADTGSSSNQGMASRSVSTAASGCTTAEIPVVRAEGIATLSSILFVPRLRADRRDGYNACSPRPARVSVMNLLRHRIGWASAACLMASFAFAPRQKNGKEQDAKKPKLTLKAQPAISMSPARVVVTAERMGGADDYEDFYCPTVAWDWGDETQSESTSDC